MLDNNTANMLREIKMGVIATAFLKQLKDGGISDLSFGERFGLLVDTEWTNRKNNRLKRLMKAPIMPSQARASRISSTMPTNNWISP